MAITISGANNVDKILATDGVLDSISGFSVVGVMTAGIFDVTGKTSTGHLSVGSNIHIGNAGIITATTLVGNVTGNINHTSNLLLQISGSEKFRVGTSGQLGIGGANYGTSGQVLTSGGSGSAATWSTISGTTINNNADNRIITGSGTANTLNGESNLTFDGTNLTIVSPDISVGTGATISSLGNVTAGIATFAGGVTFKGSNGTLHWRMKPSGSFEPQFNNFFNIGDTYYNVNNVYTKNLVLSEDIIHNLDTNTKISFPAADTISFTTAGSERLRMTSDGKIGIGIASPTFAAGGGVHLKGGNEFTSYRVTANTNTGVDFAQDAAGNGYVYNRDNADLTLGTNNAQRVRINNNGAIGLGGANYGSSGQVLTSQGSGSAVTWSTVSGTTINNNADNRVITGSGTANTLEGEAGLTYNGQAFQVNTVTSENNAFRVYNTTTGATTYHINGEGNSFIGHTYPLTDSNLDLGYHATNKWRDVVLSGGIRFGNNNAANYLDEYEEGTWSPGASGFTMASVQSATYTRIGRLVFVQCYCSTASGSGGSTVIITGLPFTVKSGNIYQYATGRLGGASYNNSQHMITFEFTTGNTYVIPKVSDGNINWGMLSNTHIMFSGCYQI